MGDDIEAVHGFGSNLKVLISHRKRRVSMRKLESVSTIDDRRLSRQHHDAVQNQATEASCGFRPCKPTDMM